MLTVPRTVLSAALVLCSAGSAPTQESVPIVATPRSGVETTIMEAPTDTETLTVWLKDTGLSPEDPIVTMRNLADFPSLRRIKFLITPQIADYGFHSSFFV